MTNTRERGTQRRNPAAAIVAVRSSGRKPFGRNTFGWTVNGMTVGSPP
ncbi:hypothetical protein QRX50_23655 [Amycolatopsis carbonis]|uniref:Uncharacterized protein n=1 Tax=Amycolatopsis carbonis TaxID=715471 RepID=A0A9Y2IP61_9PSEU|nr:hypothetical protein [Amycolatopsis sp. 2-15]WIX83534.1 hypothetical protein QRX50_23655 [Amycolatopsis sp. 2-15]